MATEKFANATCLAISWRNSEVENVKRSFGFSVPKQALPSCTTVLKTVLLLSENLHFFEMLSTFFTQCDCGCLCEATVDFSFTLQTPCDRDRINTLNFGRNLFESYTSRSFTFFKS